MPRSSGTVGLYRRSRRGPILRGVETTSIAHTLPELYRAVLERVASLELTGRRHEAFLIRRAALTAYSKAWDKRAQERLSALRVRAERVLGGMDRPRAMVVPGSARQTAPRWSRTV